MRDRVYIITDSVGVLRMTKREPTLNRGEVAVRLSVTIADECFRNPILDAAVDVPPDQTILAEADVDVEDPPEAT